MRKVLIEEAANGYVVRFTKYFGDDIITSDASVYNELTKVEQAITEYFQQD